MDFYNKQRWPAILGDEDFIASTQVTAKPLSKEVARSEAKLIRPSIQRIAQEVAKKFDVDIETLFNPKKGQRKVEETGIHRGRWSCIYRRK